MVTSPARGCARVGASHPRHVALVLLRCVLAGCIATVGGLAIRSLEMRRDGFGLRTTAARAALPLVVAVAGGLGAALGAVRHLAFLSIFRLVTRRRLAARLGDRVGDGLGGIIIPFIGIKLIDVVIVAIGLA